MSKNPKHHTPKKGCYIFQERLMRAFEKVSLARVFFAIVVRRPPSVVDTKVVLSYYRKRRRDDGSICDIIAILNERRDMMTTTSDARSNRIERDQIGTKVFLSYPLSRRRARRLTCARGQRPGRSQYSRRSRRPHTPRRPRPPARSSFATTAL